MARSRLGGFSELPSEVRALMVVTVLLGIAGAADSVAPAAILGLAAVALVPLPFVSFATETLTLSGEEHHTSAQRG